MADAQVHSAYRGESFCQLFSLNYYLFFSINVLFYYFISSDFAQVHELVYTLLNPTVIDLFRLQLMYLFVVVGVPHR